MKRFSLITLPLFLLVVFAVSCTNDNNEETAEFTGNEVIMEMIPGNVQGNATSGSIRIRERTDGTAQIDITMNGLISNAVHPVHLHFGSLADDGDVATFMDDLREADGVGISSTVLSTLSNNSNLNYQDLLSFDGSIKVHFEASGPLENEILGAINIGSNVPQNAAYLTGEKSITICNTNFSH